MKMAEIFDLVKSENDSVLHLDRASHSGNWKGVTAGTQPERKRGVVGPVLEYSGRTGVVTAVLFFAVVCVDLFVGVFVIIVRGLLKSIKQHLVLVAMYYGKVRKGALQAPAGSTQRQTT